MKILLVLLVCFLIVCVAIVVLDSNRFVVRTYEIASDKIKNPIQFVFVSDLHGKSYGKDNEKLLRAIDAQNPDFVLCGGDIPTAHPGASLETAISFMNALVRKYVVYYANGNHEYRMRIYPEKYVGMHERYEQGIKDTNIVRLLNESAPLAEEVVVHGLELERRFYRRFHKVTPSPEHIQKLFQEPIRGDGKFHIMLAHNPDYFKEYAGCGVDLILSGHLHGGVGRLPILGGVISPSLRLFPRYDGGAFQDGDTTMIVSRGLGMHTIPLRFLNPAELIAIKLVPKIIK